MFLLKRSLSVKKHAFHILLAELNLGILGRAQLGCIYVIPIYKNSLCNGIHNEIYHKRNLSIESLGIVYRSSGITGVTFYDCVGNGVIHNL
jgi:hypothetical protein